jgi:hypothetical protein
MEHSETTDWPFPASRDEPIRVDSVTEEYAYLAAWPSTDGPWERVAQSLALGTQGPEDVLVVKSPAGATAEVRFAIGSFFGGGEQAATLPNERVAEAMRAGHELAKVEGPLHPGTMPQYPVPSLAHAGSVAIPLAILGVDHGQRGLYAPPRVAVVRWPDATPVGVGDAPGFDPRQWPPRRLGDWPPATTREWDQKRLAGTIERFTALWGRHLDVWFSGDAYRQQSTELGEARQLLELLVPRELLEVYRDLSPVFWQTYEKSTRRDS